LMAESFEAMSFFKMGRADKFARGRSAVKKGYVIERNLEIVER
jgi:hypothetical protein